MRKTFALALVATFMMIGSASAGLVLTEFMANPSSLSDDFGEYIEVYNTCATPIALDGLTLTDDGADGFTFSGTGLSIAPGAFFVIGDSENTDTPSYVDATWGEGMFLLANGADEIVIEDGSGTELIRLNYTNGDPFGAGTSAVLNDILNDDSNPSNFIAETTTIGFNTGGTNSDFGSPGSAGSTVVSVVPEPASFALLGLVGLAGLVRRRR